MLRFFLYHFTFLADHKVMSFIFRIFIFSILLLSGNIFPARECRAAENGGFRIGFWGNAGTSDYFSKNNLANRETSTGKTATSGRVELELLPTPTKFFTLFIFNHTGYFIDAEMARNGSIKGNRLDYKSGSLGLTWAPFGPSPGIFNIGRIFKASQLRPSEFIISFGPGFQEFSEVRATEYGFSRLSHRAVGSKIGGRIIFPLTTRFGIETTGHWMTPFHYLGSKDNVLSPYDSWSWSMTLGLDFKLSKKLSIGAGYTRQKQRLSYTLPGNVNQVVENKRDTGYTFTFQVRF